jgi:hypothetical protein
MNIGCDEVVIKTGVEKARQCGRVQATGEGTGQGQATKHGVVSVLKR